MDNNAFNVIVGWATIGQFVVGVIALIIAIYAAKIPFPFNARQILLLAFSGFTLAVPSYIAFLVAIYLATLARATPDVLVLKATGWAVALGVVWGIIWAVFILPRLTPRK